MAEISLLLFSFFIFVIFLCVFSLFLSLLSNVLQVPVLPVQEKGNLSLSIIQLCCWNVLVSDTNICKITQSPAFRVDFKNLLETKDI